MKDPEFCIECDCTTTNIELCKYCADYQNKRYKEANDFAEKTALINVILVWACLALIAAIVGFIL